MADLSIKINADAVSAIQQFDELARSSEHVQKKIEAFANSFDTDSTQRFIDDQKLAGAAITATKGELAAVTAQTKAYEKEIASLIKNGMSPEDSAVTKLQAELDGLRGKQENLTRQTALSQQSAATFAKKQESIRASITATRGPTEALKQSTAAYQKEIERLIKAGLTPESEHIKELQKDLKNLKTEQAGQATSIKGLVGNFGSLVPAIGGAIAAYKALSGAISAAKQFMDESIAAYQEQEVTLARTEAVLQATGAAAWTSTGQMKEMAAGISDATGRTENEIMNMQNVLLGFTSITGDNFDRLTRNVIDMADVMGGDLSSQANAFGKALDTPIQGMTALSRYGFVFTEQTKQEIKALEDAGKHAEAQTKLLESMEAAFSGSATATNKAQIEQSKYNAAMLDLKAAVGESIAPARGAVLGFLTDVIKGFSEAVKNTNEFKAALKLKQDIESGAAEWGDGWVGRLKEAQTEIAIFEGSIRKIQDRAAMSKEGVMTAEQQKEIEDYKSKLNDARLWEQHIKKEIESIQAKAAADAAEAANNERLAFEAAEAAKAEAAKTFAQKLGETKKNEAQIYNERIADLSSFIKSRVDLENKDATGEDRVALIEAQEERIRAAMKLTDDQKRALTAASEELQNQARAEAEAEAAELKKQEDEAAREQKKYDDFIKREAERIEASKRYLALLADAENDSYEQKLERLAYQYELEKAALEEQQAALQELTAVDKDTRLAKEEEINLLMLESDKKYQDEKKKLEEDAAKAELERKNQVLSAASKMAGAMSALVKAAGKENRAAAVAAKVLDMARAGINTHMAISGALAEIGVPTPVKVANAIAMGIAGLAEEVSIASTPIPSAETGGRFEVPQTFTGVDNGLLRLNQGEVADITPRSESGGAGRTVHITINLDGRPLIDFVNDKIESREIVYNAGYNL